MQNNMQQETYVNNQLATFFRIARVLTTAPLHIKKITNNNYQIAVSSKYRIYSYITNTVIIILLLGFYQLRTFQIGNEIQIFLSNIITGFEIIVITSTLAIATYQGPKRMKRFISYLNQMKQINTMINNNYINIRLKKTSVIFFETVFLFLTFEIALYLYILLKTGLVLRNICIGGIMAVVNIFVLVLLESLQLQYIFIFCFTKATLNVFNQRFRSLNGALPKLFSIRIKHKKSIHFYHVYMLICKLITDINEQENLMIFFLIFLQTSRILNTIYYTVFIFTIPKSFKFDSTVCCGLLCIIILYICIKLIVFVESGHRIDVELHNAQSTVSALIRTSQENECNELNNFIMNFILYTPTIAPFSLFKLTRTFILAVLGVAASFVVTILQIILTDA